METATLANDDIILKKIDDLLSQKFARVSEIPQEISKLFPFIESKMVFEIENRKIFLLIEKEVRAPRWVSFVQKHADVLEKFGFEIGIVTLCEEPSILVLPNYKNISRAFRAKNFGLYLIRDNAFDCVFHRKLANNFGRLADEQVAPLIERLKGNKHIPLKITGKMRHLGNSLFSSPLKDIAMEYEARRFEKPDNEFDFIQHAMKDILKLSELDELEKALSFLRLTENELQTKGRRDHFLHSFQVFLIGEIMIDTHREALKEALSSNDSGILSLERTWLLASLLHDTGLPFQHREWIDGVGDIEIDLLADTRIKHFLDDLALYSSKVGEECKEKMRRILYARGRQRNFRGQSEINHGLLSAVQLLRKSGTVSPTIYQNEILPAAFSMALHDREIWHDLVREKLVPINFLEFPTVCLLILCDHLESWGRPRRNTDPQGGDVILTNLNVSSGNVKVSLWFDKISDALLFDWETKEILNRVLATEKLFNVEIDLALPENHS